MRTEEFASDDLFIELFRQLLSTPQIVYTFQKVDKFHKELKQLIRLSRVYNIFATLFDELTRLNLHANLINLISLHNFIDVIHLLYE